MFNELEYLEAGGEKFPLAFTINVMQEIQKKYGSINKLFDISKTQEPDIGAIIFFLKEAINEGIDIENEKNPEKRSFVSEKQVGRIITEIGLSECAKLIEKVISKSISENKNKIKNAKATKN
ncbi:MAG: hypothetical protein NkDv07_0604 [Candidatus Improbicoccus devescovinae]|nr:MAG: hypothetical protein NkDv07_0604 [Candidatus Improbicoccus devescovinae]